MADPVKSPPTSSKASFRRRESLAHDFVMEPKKGVQWRVTKKIQITQTEDTPHSFIDLNEGHYRFIINTIESNDGHATGCIKFRDREGNILSEESHGAIGRIYHKKHKQLFEITREHAPVSLECLFLAHQSKDPVVFRSGTTERDVDLTLEVSVEKLVEKYKGAVSPTSSPLAMYPPRKRSYEIPAEQKAALLADVPELPLAPFLLKVLGRVAGPKDNEAADERVGRRISGRTISTYPMNPRYKVRDGDPICDHFCASLSPDRIIMTVADGCNWGPKPAEAAKRASMGFMAWMESHGGSASNTKELAKIMLEGIEHAHRSVIEDKTDIWDAGATTLVGGVIAQLDTKDWIFVCAGVGDSKVYHYDKELSRVKDVTSGNRKNLTDPRDPGGRIGPHLAQGLPDFRNLGIYWTHCKPNDVFIAVSDGVHDNLDPQELGKTPRDLDLDYNSWKEAETQNPERVDEVKTQFRNFKMERLIEEMLVKTSKLHSEKKVYPNDVTKKLTNYCRKVTQKSRDFMENPENSGKKLPEDYMAYPGKMDHTTCLVARVGIMKDQL